MKAWIVQEPDEGRGDVFFANSDIEARGRAADELNGGEIAGLSCKRCPELDGLRGDRRGIVRYLLDLGWWFDDGRLTADDNPFVARDGSVYRTWAAWLAEREARALRVRRRREAESRLWGRFPFAESIRVHIEPSGMADAEIALPYLRHGTLRWLERDDAWFVPQGDLAAFRSAYTINRDAAFDPEGAGK